MLMDSDPSLGVAVAVYAVSAAPGQIEGKIPGRGCRVVSAA
jgi:hypothetical protein